LAAKDSQASGLTGVLGQIVGELRGHPPLLYGLGGGILIIGLAGAVGGIAADQLWLVVVALVVLVLAGLGAWLVVSTRPEPPQLPGVSAGGEITADDEGQVGVVRGSDPTAQAPNVRAGGHVKASGRGKIGVREEVSGEQPESSPADPES
jgi:hypothetical protein